MRNVFVGAVEFSGVCLESLLEARGDILGVFTPAAEGRHCNSDHADLEPRAHSGGRLNACPATAPTHSNLPTGIHSAGGRVR